MRRRVEPSKRAAAACLAALLPALAGAAGPAPAAVCDKPVYLTFDTGHMGVAPLVADVLARHHVKVTLFLANERTLTDGASLDDQWSPWWKARAAEGHAFGSHTYDHVYWQGDLPDGKFRVKPSAGPQTGKVQTWTAQQYCEEFGHAFHADDRPRHAAAVPRAGRQDLAGAAQGGPRMRLRARGLGAGRFPGRRAAQRQIQRPPAGAGAAQHQARRHPAGPPGHLVAPGPLGPAVLEPLVEGLQRKGYCFATLDTHPAYKGWIATHH